MLTLPDGQRVSGLLSVPASPSVGYIIAHGAGAGMAHPFLENVARELADRGVASLRYQFPAMERGSRRPDPPALAHATVRAAVEEARRQLPGLPLFAGGKSFGARMTSQAQAAKPLPGVRGLVFLGFPLHPPDRPSVERAQHLAEVAVPMLFLQGTGDEFAQLPQLQATVEALGARARLELIADADHGFHVPARTGRKDPAVRAQMLATLKAWIDAILAGHG